MMATSMAIISMSGSSHSRAMATHGSVVGAGAGSGEVNPACARLCAGRGCSDDDEDVDEAY